MSTKQDIYYLSSDQKTTIHAIIWTPDQTPVGIYQICHGMTEYIGRYEPFAEYLCAHGYVVVGNDHLGHGASVVDKSCYGYFAETKGNTHLLNDIHTLRCRTAAEYPSLPYYIMGHSMGSFLVRQYIAMHGEGLAGAIIMGTGSFAPSVLIGGRLMCSAIGFVRGQKYISKALAHSSTGTNNKKISDRRTNSDWLTRDAEVVDRYRHDPLCRIKFTVNGYANMFYSIDQCQKKSVIGRIPKSLPLLVISGEADAVGNYGKGVREAYQKYVNAGITDVTLKLYPEDRHEILNELDKDQVFADILAWLEKRIR